MRRANPHGFVLALLFSQLAQLDLSHAADRGGIDERPIGVIGLLWPGVRRHKGGIAALPERG
jgi:hypothetical protein